MPLLTVASTTSKPGSEDDFGAEVSGTQLLVPEDVARALERLSIRTAEEFVSYLYSFPGAIAATLGWKLEAVLHARDGLVTKLRGIVPDDLLDPMPTIRRVYGARAPIWRKTGR
jgi:hypothetical protein